MKKQAVCIPDDLDNGERLIPLSDVPNVVWIPRKRGTVKIGKSAVYAWVAKGIRGVKLESTKRPLYATTNGALRRFFGLEGNRPVDLGLDEG